jgi:2-dehydropantoate 2-reductase
VLSCKAYDLEGAIDSFAPAVGPTTAIMPLLNGMAHLDKLDARFGADKVLGGLCLISTMLNPEGHILHLAEPHALTFGERDGKPSVRATAILAQFTGARFAIKCSETILQDMWEKWVFIATAAGLTGMMRATIGDIVASGGASIATDLLAECGAIAKGQGFAPREAASARGTAMFTAAGSGLTASLARDIEAGLRIESEQILGDLLRRAETPPPVLRIAYAHLKAYEARRARESAA